MIDIYCDESRQDLLFNKDAITASNRYVCLGGVWVPQDQRKCLKQDIANLKAKYNIKEEFKWGNVSPNKLDFYIELVSLFFEDKYSEVGFRCLVVDAMKIDDSKYNNSDHELGYYKFYYQLLFKWLNQSKNYYIFTDYKTNKERDRLSRLKTILNNSLQNDSVKELQAIDSKESLILQWQNILMGVVAYKYNLGSAGESWAKMRLVEYFEERLGNAIKPTTSQCHKVNIFEINFREK